MVFGIILAAGKGSRMKIEGTNKTAVHFSGKPLVQYGIDLFSKTVDKTVLVVGAFSESILKTASLAPGTLVAHQAKRLGTGHATLAAVREIEKQQLSPEIVLIGYGDHMMFYTPEAIAQLIAKHRAEKADLSFITTQYDEPEFLAWGRIVRDSKGKVLKIVEQKDATTQERAITEVNPGFYCVSYPFLREALRKIKKSPTSGEYYLTDLTEIAIQSHKRVSTLQVPFELVGIGINTHEQLLQSVDLYEKAEDDTSLSTTV
jgi:bifunctional UDP-N-acetylglucosamine pyrophosphorylase/glucosamine-1-phosphate N-acetyltransferase